MPEVECLFLWLSGKEFSDKGDLTSEGHKKVNYAVG